MRRIGSVFDILVVLLALRRAHANAVSTLLLAAHAK